jgi:superfamily II RNA helicase
MEFEEEGDSLVSNEESFDELEESGFVNLSVTSLSAKKNYAMTGQEDPEEKDHITMAGHQQLLSDKVHLCLQEVLQEVKLPYKLSEFQLISLHVLGSSKNLMLVNPTGSGKTNVI